MTFDADLVDGLARHGRVLLPEILAGRPQAAFRRDSEVEMLIRHLDRAKQKSLLLVGPSGCGKSAVLQELFLRVALRDSDPWLVVETSTSLLMAGTQYIGDWQTRLHELLDLADSEDHILVYCTDVPQMVGAGTHSRSQENMASTIAPYLKSGELVLIGECTDDVFARQMARYPWFQRLFTVVQIQPHDETVVAEVIQSIADQRARQLGDDCGVPIGWSAGTINAIDQFGRLYFSGMEPPSGAVQLIDQLLTTKRSRIESIDQPPESDPLSIRTSSRR